MNKEQQLIDNVLDYFNFHKVADVMQYMKWQWAFCDDVGSIPTESTLRKEARKKLLRHVQAALDNTDETYICGSGGFVYTVFKEQGNIVAVDLKFCIEEFQANVEE